MKSQRTQAELSLTPGISPDFGHQLICIHRSGAPSLWRAGEPTAPWFRPQSPAVPPPAAETGAARAPRGPSSVQPPSAGALRGSPDPAPGRPSRDGAPHPLPPAHVISPRESKPDPAGLRAPGVSGLSLSVPAERGGHAASVRSLAPAGPLALGAAAAAVAAGLLPGARRGGSQAQRAAAAHRRPRRGARRHGNASPRPSPTPPYPPLLGAVAVDGCARPDRKTRIPLLGSPARTHYAHAASSPGPSCCSVHSPLRTNLWRPEVDQGDPRPRQPPSRGSWDVGICASVMTISDARSQSGWRAVELLRECVLLKKHQEKKNQPN